MGIKAKLGAGVWDFLVCVDCNAYWSDEDVDYEWTDDPEFAQVQCPRCQSTKVIREERG